MDRADREPRRIETVRDVEAILGSAMASFVELMDCVTVTKAAGEWRLRHQAAERAFLEIEIRERAAPKRLGDAAAAVIDNYLKLARTIDELPKQVSEATRWLLAHGEKLEAAGAGHVVADEAQTLDELLVLLNNTEPSARVRLCSRLRRLDRSDLAVEAVRPVVDSDPENVPALTTLGAAYCDTGEFAMSELALRTALRVRSGEGRAQVALSRTLQCVGRTVEAFDLATLAFEADVNTHTAHRLLAAAAALGRSDAFDEALEAVENAADSHYHE